MRYNGLSNKEVIESRKKYGSNVISKKKQDSFLRLFVETLGDPIIKILLIALSIKVVFLFKDFDFFETIGIVCAIIISSFISTISEYGSSRAFARLQEESSMTFSRVIRDGHVSPVDTSSIVVGDIVLLSGGDRIPADGYIVKGSISVDESSINGESKEVYKYASVKDILSENKVYKGTVVYDMEAMMQVTSVGDNTMYGHIASELQEKEPVSPLKIRLTNLAKVISKIGYVCAFVVSISYLFSVVVVQNNFNLDLIYKTITNGRLMFGYVLYALTLSVTLIVVSVPEGLPMMITLVLSSNMRRMLKKNVLVRKLVGIETAGSMNILFTDKTGTLTKGKLEVIGILSSDMHEFGNFSDVSYYKKYKEMLVNSLVYNNDSIYDVDSNSVIGGNITDKAIMSYMKVPRSDDVKIIRRIPFNSKNKYMISVIDNKRKMRLIKGAPEVVIDMCNSYYDVNMDRHMFLDKSDIMDRVIVMTKMGIRVIAFAVSDDVVDIFSKRSVSLLGLVFIKDDVRKEAIEGIRLVDSAGIQTVMVTGDNKDTALAIAREVGIVKSDDDIVLSSSSFNSMSDEEVGKILGNLRVLARSLPKDKSRLVNIARKNNLVVGMTGDGVNDAPALKRSDVGFAMGSGTEVAKEASDIVILDDNFMSIVNAILFGRTIFKSIRKFIIFQLTVNICAVLISLIGPFIGINQPVTVIQMLWINMVMDTLAGIAFAYEAPMDSYMMEAPKKKDENIVNKYMLNQILVMGLYTTILCILFLKMPMFTSIFRDDGNNGYLMTAFFGLFIFASIFNSFNARTHRINILSNILRNKVFLMIILLIVIIQIYLIYYGGELFRTIGLSFSEFNVMLLVASSVIPVDFVRKIILRLRGVKGGV